MNKKKAITEILQLLKKPSSNLDEAKREISKKYKIEILQNSEIINIYKKLVATKKIEADLELEKKLRKRAVRTLSGIAPVAVLTKPWPCPGNCAYCPNQPGVPVSYLSNEPAVMRAIRCGYHPYKQTALRLQALVNNGHQPNKIEIIVIGGTWSALATKYKYWYIANCFAAANNFQAAKDKKRPKIKRINSQLSLNEIKKELTKQQKINQTAEYKIIGLTLETRPDYLDDKELLQMRQLGCTRVEMGVQALNDEILTLNKRGHGVAEIAKATAKLRAYGFKLLTTTCQHYPVLILKKI
jgi:elongator complex protein 3